MSKINSSTPNYIKANRESWNETAGVHLKHYVEELYEKIADPEFTTFDKVEKGIFADIGIEGKNVIQLCCNNGRELISVKKQGAARSVGVDLSDEFIEQGQKLSKRAGVELEFIRSNVYELPGLLKGQFDIVYITIGAMGWLPDIPAFFEIVASLLRTEGQLFIYEMHPILNMFDSEKGDIVEDSYFRKEPFVNDDDVDYFDPSKKIEAVSYWFPHRVADVIQGCINNGLKLTHFEEYAHDISMTYKSFEQYEKRLPLSYSLIAEKE